MTTQPAHEPSFRFGLSEFTTQPWTFEDDVRAYSDHKADAMEVCEVKLDPNRLRDQLSHARRSGLALSSAQPLVRTLFPSRSQPYPVSVGERMDRFRQTIARFGEFAAGVPFVTNTGPAPRGDIQDLLDVAGREYQGLADYASAHGARVALEPLNPSIMNVESAIWTLAQGLALVEAVDRDNFGICVDYWNIWQEQRVLDSLKHLGDRIFVVQVSDWRTPRSDRDRLIPGDGEIPLAPLMAATRSAGYTGPYVVEIFSDDVPDSLWNSDLDGVIEQSRVGAESAWTASFRDSVRDPRAQGAAQPHT